MTPAKSLTHYETPQQFLPVEVQHLNMYLINCLSNFTNVHAMHVHCVTKINIYIWSEHLQYKNNINVQNATNFILQQQ